MQIQPGTTAPQAIEKLDNPGAQQTSTRNGGTVEPAPTKASASAEVLERLLVQVVARRNDGLAQLKTLIDGKILNLQTSQLLKPGQLALVETRQTSGLKEVSLQTQGRPLVEQILRLLTPHAGDLKGKLTNVVQLPPLKPVASQNPGSQQIGNAKTQSGAPQPGAVQTASSREPSPILQGLRALITSVTAGSNPSNTQTSRLSAESAIGTNPARMTNGIVNSEVKDIRPGSLLSQLPSTSQLRDPSQVPPLLRGGQVPALLKLVLPLLQTTLQQAPVNGQQQQARDAHITAITQLAARILLGAVRSPNNGAEVEVSRNEWITRFDQSLDSLQVELHVIRESKQDNETERDAGQGESGEKVRQWRVRLAFEFEELGLITAFVILNAERKLEVQFWTEQESTRLRLQEFRSRFHTRLETALDSHGVEHLEIGVFEGTPPPSAQRISTHLIDETA